MKFIKVLAIILAFTIGNNISIFAQETALEIDNHRLLEGKSFSVIVTGDGPDVVLIPGLATPRDVWNPLRDKLSKTHRLHIVQIRGFGDDPKSNAEFTKNESLLDAFTFELADYIDNEITDKGLAAPAIIGHSLGGLSAMMIAARHPEEASKIMVVDSLPFFGLLFGPTMTVDAMKPQAEFLRNSIASRPKGQVDERGLVVQSISEEGREQVKIWSQTAEPKVMAQLFYEVASTDIRSELPAIKAPITMLYPIDTSVIPAERISAIYENAYSGAKNATLIPIMDSRHFIMLDQFKIFSQQVISFLNNSK